MTPPAHHDRLRADEALLDSLGARAPLDPDADEVAVLLAALAADVDRPAQVPAPTSRPAPDRRADPVGAAGAAGPPCPPPSRPPWPSAASVPRRRPRGCCRRGRTGPSTPSGPPSWGSPVRSSTVSWESVR
ncbi:hypothetical protein HJG43_02745 [Kineosporiaceae bacterium SCSIO 59966]|nr:hypothetical protein HJG43_02745 [Kineosporiaceae bacterium SCSIO 59966]